MKPVVVVALSLFLMLSPGRGDAAVVVGDLYAAEVEVGGRDDRSLAAAFREALDRVLVKVTGQRDAARDDAFGALRSEARALVQQWSYTDDGLWAAFDAAAVNRALDALGRPRWGAERPRTLVWVSLDDGVHARRVLAAADGAFDAAFDGLMPLAPGQARPPLLAPLPVRSPVLLHPPLLPAAPQRPGAAGEDTRVAMDVDALRDRLLSTAGLRGLPLELPRMDSREFWQVRAEDICAGREAPLMSASRRYQADAVLLGCARVLGDTAVVRWTMLFGGERQSWDGALEDGVDRAADELGRALAAAAGLAGITRLRVTGVASLRDYARVLTHLEGLSLIDTVDVEAVEADALVLRLSTRADDAQLRRALAIGRVLESVDAGAAGQPARYTLVR